MAGPVSMHRVVLIEVRAQMGDAVGVSKQLLTASSIIVSTVVTPQVIGWVDSLE